jgi:hypothetical protein
MALEIHAESQIEAHGLQWHSRTVGECVFSLSPFFEKSGLPYGPIP